MRIIKWLKSRIKREKNKYPEIKVILPSIEELKGEGKEQKEVKKETLIQVIKDGVNMHQIGLRSLRDNQKTICEKLENSHKELEERQIEIIKMLMSIKEKI